MSAPLPADPTDTPRGRRPAELGAIVRQAFATYHDEQNATWVKFRYVVDDSPLTRKQFTHGLAWLHEQGAVERWNPDGSSPYNWRLVDDGGDDA